MPMIKFALFATFTIMLSAMSISQSHAAQDDVVMQQQCPDGKVWSEEKQRCIPERPRGSH